MCPACGGLGRIDDPTTSQGLTCGACEGTGNREAARLLRAYRRGYADGIEAMRQAMPNGYGGNEPLGLFELLNAIREEEAAWEKQD